MRGFPIQVPSSAPHFPAPPAKGDHANQPFLPGSFQPSPTCAPASCQATPTPRRPGNSWPGPSQAGVCTGGFYGGSVPFGPWRPQGQWHCLDKPEVTSLGSSVPGMSWP